MNPWLLIDEYRRVPGGALRHRFTSDERVAFWEVRRPCDVRFNGHFATEAEAEKSLEVPHAEQGSEG